VRAVRPRQWVKNLLVFVAPAAAGALHHPHQVLQALGAFGLFCLAASGTYLLNDVADAEADRQHPTKRNRPVASGALGVPLAIFLGLAFLAGALVCSGLLAGWSLTLVIGIYASVTVAYTLWIKHQPVLELVAVASGFILRAIAGGVATHVPLTNWFLVVTSFGALFVVTGKRMAEHQLEGLAVDYHRPVLADYSKSFLQSTLVLTATVTVTAYCLWAFERGGLSAHSGHQLVWTELTVVPVVIAVLHVLRLLDAGKGGAPEDLVLKDPVLITLGLLWAVLFAVGIYG
jgi:decaprenyl-phosphate phosphoribosyltransferase